MLNSFKDSLTKVTDLTILFASIFTFLAFVTPKEISVGPIQESRERISISQSELRETKNALSESLAMTDSLQTTVNQLNAAKEGLEPNQDLGFSGVNLTEFAELINIELTELDAIAELEKKEAENKGYNQRIASLEMAIISEQQKISNLEDRRNSSKSISWVQPIRKNVEPLATAAGMDGILAGFSALIFCLVCKRRKQWFKNIFRIFYK